MMPQRSASGSVPSRMSVPLELAGVLLLERLHRDAGRARVAGVGLLLAAGLAAERREQPVQVVEAVGVNALDVRGSPPPAAAAAPPAARPRGRRSSRSAADPPRRLLGGQVLGQQERLHVLAVLAMHVDDASSPPGSSRSPRPAPRRRGTTACPAWRVRERAEPDVARSWRVAMNSLYISFALLADRTASRWRTRACSRCSDSRCGWPR